MARMTPELTVVLDKLSYLEGPRWHDGRVWVSDFYTHQVLSALPDGSDPRVEAEVPTQPSGLGWLPDGRLLIVSMRDHRLLRREASGELVVHADLSEFCTGHLNDMVVDSAGRAYVGNFGFDLMAGDDMRTAALVRVDPDGTATQVADDLYFPNGAAIIRNGSIGSDLVVAETLGNRISAFALGADGSVGERRDWATFGDPPADRAFGEVLAALVVGADGICADAEGAVWAADALGNRAVRIVGGEIVQTVDAGTGVFAVTLGGDDGHTLFLCTAPSFAEHERRDTRDAVLLATRVEVPATIGS
jgi:sugar lactone lactonase YvrE